jgi:hypothetical protein
MILGSGCRTNDSTWPCTMINNTPESLYVGFNSDIPTLVVTRSNGTSTTGNVGISKTSPTYKLDVGGDVNITGTYRVNGAAFVSGINGTGTDLYVPKWTSAGTKLTNSSIYDNGGQITLGTSAMNLSLPGLINSDLTFRPDYTATIIGGSGGASAPYDGMPLSIKGGAATGGGFIGGNLYLDGGTPTGGSAAGNVLIQTGVAGNVGISKTPSSIYKLDVAGDINITGSYRINGVAFNPVTGTGASTNVAKWTGPSSLGNSIMTENATGVGIGIANPGQKLDIQPTAGYPSILLRSSSASSGGAYIFMLTANGSASGGDAVCSAIVANSKCLMSWSSVGSKQNCGASGSASERYICVGFAL